MSDYDGWFRTRYIFARRRKNYEIDLYALAGMLGEGEEVIKLPALAIATDRLLKRKNLVPSTAILLMAVLPIECHTILLAYEDNSFAPVAEYNHTLTEKIDFELPGMEH